MKKIIGEFQGDYRFLSNFYQVVVTYQGEEYPSLEHAYQAAKTNDLAVRRSIMLAPTSGRAKRLGQRAELVPHWDTKKFLVMYELLTSKFNPWSDLATRLIETEDAELIEGNHWHDNIWGDCHCDGTGHPFCLDRGQNWLGRLLMVVREEIRQ